MNVVQKFFVCSQNDFLELPFINSTGVSIAFDTIDSGTTIQVDFGDGIVQSVLANNNYVTYGFPTARSGRVRILTAGRLTVFRCGTAYLTDWSFTIASLDICRNLDTFQVRSGNVSGNVANLSQTVRWFSVIAGVGAIGGNTNNIPSGIEILDCRSTNTDISIDIETLQIERPNITGLFLSGRSECTGDIHNLPANITGFSIRNTGLPRLHQVTYTAGRTWAPNMTTVYIASGGVGLTTAEVDNLLIDLANTGWNTNGFSVVNLATGNAPRSSASDSAVASLQSMNVGVTVNT